MEDVLSWGLAVVRVAQSFASPALTLAMKVVSAGGTIYLYGILLPFAAWCVDYRFGVQLALLSVFSGLLNAWLKVLFAQPRPYQLDASLGLAKEPSYGLPSGHSQSSAVFWGVAASRLPRLVGVSLAIGIPLIVGFSRIYLGVHFPTDVFAGWAIGGMIAVAWLVFGSDITRFVSVQNVRLKILAAAVAAFFMNMLNREETGLAGLFLGVAGGAAFLPELGGYRAAGTLPAKAARYGIGMAGAGLIYFGLKAILPGEGDQSYALFRFARYGLLGAWISLGAPLAFIRLGLAEAEMPMTAGGTGIP
ncbi:MAG: phosphatase PAP2 family protein [Spirochaetes bacterium]|nr:phosphatase PAP2 family protein [Spirochaetota bacterium]